MDKDDIKIGMYVDYHDIIGGPATKPHCKVVSTPWQLGHGQWVVKIDKIRGGVSLDSITAVRTPAFAPYLVIEMFEPGDTIMPGGRRTTDE